MTGRGKWLIAALAAFALLLGGLSACGSGSDAGSTRSNSTAAAGGEKASRQGGVENGEGQESGGEGKRQGSKEGGSQNTSAPVSPLHVSGGGSGQYRVRGGDNSVQEFGEESSEGELEAAAGALHDFYVARAREDWKAACAQLSKTVAGQIEQLGAQAKSGAKGCPATLAAITSPLPPAVQRETTIVDAGSLRVEGDHGFLIYRGAEKAVYAINMSREDGEWKVGALAGIPLS